MKLTVQVSSTHGDPTSIGCVNGRRLAIDLATDGRSGEGITAGELLCLAVGAGFADELFAEAERRSIRIERTRVTVEAESRDGGRTARDLAVSVCLEADADEPEVMDLIERTDRTSNSLNWLRLGSPVRVADAQLLTKR